MKGIYFFGMNPSPQNPPQVPPQDPNQPPKKVRVRWIPLLLMILLPFVIVGIGLGQFWWPSYQQSKIRNTGTKTTAKITAIEPTGNLYNSQPQVKLTLLVDAKEGDDFTAETKMVINQVYLPQVQPGTTVTVYYDPADHSKVAVE